MLHMAGPPAEGQKVFIAVAAYEGCGAGFTYALFHTGVALGQAGIGRELAIYSGNCHVDDSRNRLVRDFLSSDCTDLVFLDADVGWNASDFLKLLAFDRDVVAGVYPKKHGDDTFPMKLLPGEIWSDRDGLIEVQGVPTGFLRIRRHVLVTLAATAQTYNAKNDGAYATPCIFERQIHAGTRWGGDYVFCRKWREAGGKIFIDPSMRFEHSGEDTWVGQAGAWMRKRAGIGLVEPLKAIREGRDTLEDLMDLRDVWDNDFATSYAMLTAMIAVVRAKGGPVLELGSGLSTLVMASANPQAQIHCLENSPVFAEHLRIEARKLGLANIVIHCRPLQDGWYDMGGVPDLDWTLVVIDGPPKVGGGRRLVFERLDLSRTAVFADDVQRDGGDPAMVEALKRTHDVWVCEADKREFAIGAPRRDREAKAV